MCLQGFEGNILNPKNGGLEDDVPFQLGNFRFQPFIFRGVDHGPFKKDVWHIVMSSSNRSGSLIEYSSTQAQKQHFAAPN